VYQDLISAQDASTKGFNTGPQPVSSSSSSSLLGLGALPPILGIGKSRSSSTTVQTISNGAKVKDQWLQPYYDKIRYGIGIRELSVARYKFAPVSEFISVPFTSPKEIIKVNIVVDEYIPPQFDPNQTWIKYYIKVEGDNDWLRTNPINSPTKFDEAGEIIPKIINFNVSKPTTAQLEDKYNTTEEEVKQVRFRAVLSRPQGGDEESITPMLKSYRLVMIPRR
jgi:hypothetical protein